jgi:hypothetical protein
MRHSIDNGFIFKKINLILILKERKRHFSQKKIKSMQWFNIAKLAIFKVTLLHQYMELKNFF